MEDFIVGRYEAGDISLSTPVTKRMNTDIVNQTWYNMYYRMRNINSNKNIQTSMIWGCLWDETLQWLIDTETKTYADMINSTSWGNYRQATFTYKRANGDEMIKNQNEAIIIPTGSTEYTKANNIYDIAGNVWEYTIEGTGRFRYLRGGYGYTNYYPVSYRQTIEPDNLGGKLSNTIYVPGVRAFFYIR